MKKIKRILCVVLLIGLPLSFSAPNSYAGTSLSSITNDSIKQKQDQISQSQQLKKQLQANITAAKQKKKELEGLKSDVLNYIQKVDAELSAIQEKIEEYNQLIAEKQAEIEQTTEELNEAIEVENTQYEAMKNRIRFMYKKGDSMYLEIMLSAESFGDFLTKADYIEKLEAYDRGKLDEYRAVREWTELVKATLEAEKEVLDEVQNAQKIEEANLQELLNEKNAQLNEYSRQIAN
ncbi:MAG: peptidase M23, partial [Lachnospiraceae bacterium]|nr:peptidase M23 [Lachnospiraceae bacterium]